MGAGELVAEFADFFGLLGDALVGEFEAASDPSEARVMVVLWVVLSLERCWSCSSRSGWV